MNSHVCVEVCACERNIFFSHFVEIQNDTRNTNFFIRSILKSIDTQAVIYLFIYNLCYLRKPYAVCHLGELVSIFDN